MELTIKGFAKPMKIILNYMLILSALNGCSPGMPVTRPVEVQVPVAITCLPGKIMPPQWNVPALAPDATATGKLKAVLADLELSQGYIEELESLLAACS